MPNVIESPTCARPMGRRRRRRGSFSVEEARSSAWSDPTARQDHDRECIEAARARDRPGHCTRHRSKDRMGWPTDGVTAAGDLSLGADQVRRGADFVRIVLRGPRESTACSPRSALKTKSRQFDKLSATEARLSSQLALSVAEDRVLR